MWFTNDLAQTTSVYICRWKFQRRVSSHQLNPFTGHPRVFSHHRIEKFHRFSSIISIKYLNVLLESQTQLTEIKLGTISDRATLTEHATVPSLTPLWAFLLVLYPCTLPWRFHLHLGFPAPHLQPLFPHFLITLSPLKRSRAEPFFCQDNPNANQTHFPTQSKKFRTQCELKLRQFFFCPENPFEYTFGEYIKFYYCPCCRSILFEFFRYINNFPLTGTFFLDI